MNDEIKLSPIGEHIRKYREAQSMTRQELADKIGISLSSYKRIITGAPINLDTAILIADALGISLDDLVGRAAPAPASGAEISRALIAEQAARIEEKDKQLADCKETIRAQRRSIKRYTIFFMAVLAALVFVMLFDITNGHVGYVRYDDAHRVDYQDYGADDSGHAFDWF